MESEPIYRIVESPHVKFDETQFLGAPGLMCLMQEEREDHGYAGNMHCQSADDASYEAEEICIVTFILTNYQAHLDIKIDGTYTHFDFSAADVTDDNLEGNIYIKSSSSIREQQSFRYPLRNRHPLRK